MRGIETDRGESRGTEGVSKKFSWNSGARGFGRGFPSDIEGDGPGLREPWLAQFPEMSEGEDEEEETWECLERNDLPCKRRNPLYRPTCKRCADKRPWPPSKAKAIRESESEPLKWGNHQQWPSPAPGVPGIHKVFPADHGSVRWARQGGPGAAGRTKVLKKLANRPCVEVPHDEGGGVKIEETSEGGGKELLNPLMPEDIPVGFRALNCESQQELPESGAEAVQEEIIWDHWLGRERTRTDESPLSVESLTWVDVRRLQVLSNLTEQGYIFGKSPRTSMGENLELTPLEFPRRMHGANKPW